MSSSSPIDIEKKPAVSAPITLACNDPNIPPDVKAFIRTLDRKDLYCAEIIKTDDGYTIIDHRGDPHIFQYSRPVEGLITNRVKRELTDYLRDIQDTIEAEDNDKQFMMLVKPQSQDKKKKDIFQDMLIKIHNSVVFKINRLDTAEQKRRYIDKFIATINRPDFAGKQTTMKRMKRKPMMKPMMKPMKKPMKKNNKNKKTKKMY